MGETLIIIGMIFGFITIAMLYVVSIIGLFVADYWWQKLLGILFAIGLPILLMVVGATITLNC